MKTNKKTLHKPKLLRKEEEQVTRVKVDSKGTGQFYAVSRYIKVINWKGRVIREYLVPEPPKKI